MATTTTSDRHPVFRDGDLDRIVARRGVVTCPWLDDDERAALDAAVDELDLDGSSGFHDTAAVGLGFDERQAVHELLVDAFSEPARRVLAGYEPVMSAVMTKWPGPGGEKTIHRDFQLVDERRFRTVCVWVPLDDVDADNGALRVLPGSHLVPTGIRSVPRTPEHPPDPLQSLTMADLEPVAATAGTAVVFDLAVVHGSDVNRSEVPRRAVGVAYAPAAADLSLRYVHDDGRVELLQVDDPDVFRRIDWGRRPTELRSAGDVEPHGEAVDRGELLRRSRLVAAGD